MPVIHLAHSPDADDAFMFYALTQGKVNTGDLIYQHTYQDLETLNRWALEGRFEVTAVSFHAYAYLADRYLLLPSGASLGEGYGPIVVAREPGAPADLSARTVAVPGRLTTAYLALKLFAPEVETTVLPFAAILPAVAQGQVEAGLLIHEGQLTYGEYHLHCVLDLGTWWQAQYGLPLPLGGNVVRRDVEPTWRRKIAHHLRASIEYALTHREEALTYACQFARGLSLDLVDRFVSLYVNERTLDYGLEGREAVRLLLAEGYERGLIPQRVEPKFAGD
ncbi:MAG TPA: ABC transporter substrate-binding protein [Armatimonadetes bacterium]|nr:ABC transporter substrate-binding protein [Armatimonadota bacterium]